MMDRFENDKLTLVLVGLGGILFTQAVVVETRTSDHWFVSPRT